MSSVRHVATLAGVRRFNLPLGTPIRAEDRQQLVLPLDVAEPNPRLNQPRDVERLQRRPSLNDTRVEYRHMVQRMETYFESDDGDYDVASKFYDDYGIDLDLAEGFNFYGPANYVAAGPWTMFGACRQIRQEAYDMLGFKSTDQTDTGGDPHLHGGDPGWGGGNISIPDPDVHAYALLLGLRDGERVDQTLYRGTSITDAEAFAMTLREGQTFDMPLASFANHRGHAERFGTDVVFVLQKGSRAVGGGDMGPPPNISEDHPDYWDIVESGEYQEMISGGRFRITGVRKNPKGYSVLLRQLAVFDPETGVLTKQQSPRYVMPKFSWMFDRPYATPRQPIRPRTSTKALPKTQKCKYCDEQATKRIIWAEGAAYVPVCDAHLGKGKQRIGGENEVNEVRDIKDVYGGVVRNDSQTSHPRGFGRVQRDKIVERGKRYPNLRARARKVCNETSKERKGHDADTDITDECPGCGDTVVFDTMNGWQRLDGSYSHDDYKTHSDFMVPPRVELKALLPDLTVPLQSEIRQYLDQTSTQASERALALLRKTDELVNLQQRVLDIEYKFAKRLRKRVAKVRTQGGVDKYKQPIGSIIVADGTMPDIEWVGDAYGDGQWDRIRGTDGVVYESGFDATNDSWVAIRPNDDDEYTWDDANIAVEQDTEADMLKALNDHVASKKKTRKAPAKKAPAKKAPAKRGAVKGRAKTVGKKHLPIFSKGPKRNKTPRPDYRPMTKKELASVYPKGLPQGMERPRWNDNWDNDVDDKLGIPDEYYSGLKGIVYSVRTGKPSYIYDERALRIRNEKKFGSGDKAGQVQTFLDNFDQIEARLRKDAPTNDAAAAFMIQMVTGMRVGNRRIRKERLVQEERFGASNLKVEHISIKGNEVTFDFTGKGGVEHDHTVTNKDLASVLRHRMKGKKKTDYLFDTDDSDVADYFKGVQSDLGISGLKPHNARHAMANTIALREIGTFKKRLPKNKTEFKKWQNQVCDVVAHILGNTRAQARTSYIDDKVWDRWRQGNDW